MQGFENYNPITISLYFLTVAGIAMFCMNPILLGISLLGASSLFILRNKQKELKSHFMYLGLFIVMSLVNPLFSHNGATVLFVINDSPITLEATVYGIVAALMVLSVLYWFRSFTQIMTSDRLLYVFGKLSPKLTLVLSMGLRYIPLFVKQTKKVNNTQIAMGLYKEDNILDMVKGGIRVFSVMLTWALENGIVTADSMAARGYGTHKRTNFSIFRFRKADSIFIFVTLLLGTMVCVAVATNTLDFNYYPEITYNKISHISILGLSSYTLLSFLPIITEIKEEIKWKYLRSKI